MMNKSLSKAVVAASGLLMATAIAAAPGFTASAAAASPVGSPSSAQKVAGKATNTTRVQEIVQASDNHDGVKGWVYNKSSHTMIVHIGSHYHPDTESFFLKPGEDFTYACGVSLNLQFQKQGDNACVSAEDPAIGSFKVWDWQNLSYRTMSEKDVFSYNDTSRVCNVELTRQCDGNRGIFGENSYTTDWPNLDVVVTDAS